MRAAPAKFFERRCRPRSRWLKLTLVLVAAVSLSCGESATAPHPTPSDPSVVRMLFIGNSLTAENDLPGMVRALSIAAGDSAPIETRMVAYGGYALEDHLARGDAARAIQEERWNVVVLQQGPSSLPESRENLIEYARRFATLIRQSGAEPAMYGVWPEAARIGVLEACIESYRAAADSIHGILYPAALAWKHGWQMDPALPLYGPDAFHPSTLGTYTAALVIYARVRGRSPVGLPHRFDQNGASVALDSVQAHRAQLAAASATGT